MAPTEGWQGDAQYLAVLLGHPGVPLAATDLTRSADLKSENAENARVRVTRALRPVLRRIAEHHPALGLHLQATIRTGKLCAYTPDPRVRLRWSTK